MGNIFKFLLSLMTKLPYDEKPHNQPQSYALQIKKVTKQYQRRQAENVKVLMKQITNTKPVLYCVKDEYTSLLKKWFCY